MSETPSSEPTAPPGPVGPRPGVFGAGRPPARPVGAPKTGQWLPFLTLAIALVGLGVGIGAWLRPIAGEGEPPVPAAPTYTEEQIAQAKANVCEAYRLVKQVIVSNTHRSNPVPGDAIGDLATGIYGDVSLYQGGDYLLNHLIGEPALPEMLASSATSAARTMKRLAMIDLAGDPDSVRATVHHEVNEQLLHLDELCR